jgi:hypothetical protein
MTLEVKQRALAHQLDHVGAIQPGCAPGQHAGADLNYNAFPRSVVQHTMYCLTSNDTCLEP